MSDAYTYPVSTQWWYSRGARVFVHQDYLDSDIEDSPPNFPVDFTETDNLGGRTPFLLRNETGPMFPADLGPFRYGSGFAGKLNRADVAGSGDIDPVTGEELRYDFDRFGPLAPKKFRTQDGHEIYYEDFSVNAIYNVKTWKLSGTLGSKSINVTVAAGTSQYFDTDNDSKTDPAPERPNEGKRGAYPTEFGVFGATSSGDKPKGGEAIFSIGGLGGGFLSGGVEEVYNLKPVPYVLVPRFTAVISIVGGYQVSAGFPSNKEGSQDNSLTFLGEPVYTLTEDGMQPQYSLNITAEERWTRDDDWVSE